MMDGDASISYEEGQCTEDETMSGLHFRYGAMRRRKLLCILK
jgi:hypothetical protein